MADGKLMWTIRKILAATEELFVRRGVAEARLDAELLLAHALSVGRIDLFLDRDRPLSASELDRYRALVKERAGPRVPIAYLTGHREFYSLDLEVTRDVLVPRPETEVIVDIALDELRRRGAAARAGEPARGAIVADLGTGSGCIAVALAKLAGPLVERVFAIDASAAALAVALRNAERHGVADRVATLEGDLFASLAGHEDELALVVSNPPYVAESERASLAPEVLAEPPLALFAGADGLDAIRAIAAAAPRFLVPGGLLLVEHGAAQGPAAAELARAAGLMDVSTQRDLAGKDRVLVARRPEVS